MWTYWKYFFLMQFAEVNYCNIYKKKGILSVVQNEKTICFQLLKISATIKSHVKCSKWWNIKSLSEFIKIMMDINKFEETPASINKTVKKNKNKIN